jgi:hypothetical protein
LLTVGGANAETLFASQSPVLADATDGVVYELGMKFRVARTGQISAIRYWESQSDVGTHIGRIWFSSGQQLASVKFVNETASGWQTQSLAAPLSIQDIRLWLHIVTPHLR